LLCHPVVDHATVHDRAMRRFVLGLAALEVVVLLMVPAPPNPDKPGRSGGIRTAAAQLRGEGPPVDLVQDYVGARAIAGHDDEYPLLTDAFARVGLDWRAPHRSTHPPTAFLLVLPVSWLPWTVAAATWAAAMIAAIATAWWAFGLRSELAVTAAPLTLLWPAASWSLGQLTALWLLGIALGWKFRERPQVAGAAIALASLTKLLPALALVPFLVLRRWSVVRGFAAVWAVAIAALLVLDARAFARYVEVAKAGGREQAARGENSALIVAAEHDYGTAGLLVAICIVAAVLGSSLRRLRARASLDRWSWDAWTWAGVALLPIAWIYSLLPLLPALTRLARRGGAVASALALVTFTIPFVIDPFGLPGGIRLAIATASMGLALLAAAHAPAVRRRVAPVPRLTRRG
jgi:Glycosyltransferase family 87